MPYQKYLEFATEELTEKGGLDTAREIAGQPELWMEVYNLLEKKRSSLQSFIQPILAIDNLRVILTGAGSSAFIGESSQGIFQTESGKITQAIATTDIVTHPSLFFIKNIPTLMVSFARSGNSPESIEAIRLANIHCEHIFHLIITCNGQGDLGQLWKGKNIYTLVLPERSNDKSLAMTGSFTSMLLAIVLIAHLPKLDQLKKKVQLLAENADGIINNHLFQLSELFKNKYDRVIFLGSGSTLGIARECHLKLQELTDGKLICKHDSFLGFRHGPRAVTNKSSLVVYLFSGNDKVYQYEKDLAETISSDTPDVPVMVVGRKISDLNNVVLEIDAGQSDELSFIALTLIGQLMGFFASLKLGLQPDSPSVNGIINRVVQGVVIYQ